MHTAEPRPAAAPPAGRATMAPALHEATNYHAWTHSWVAPYLEPARRILDIGSGTANHLSLLGDRDLVSVDIDPRVIAELRERFAQTRPRWRFEALDLTRPEALDQLGRGSFDVVFSSNVFEHIEDDGAVFKAAYEALEPGGRIVLVLPAHQRLYGGLDRIAGHHRRYDAPLIRERFARAGFVEDEIRFVNAVGAVGWFVNSRFVSHRRIDSAGIGLQVRLFDRALVPLLRRLESGLRPPFGQSVVAVGRKPRG